MATMVVAALSLAALAIAVAVAAAATTAAVAAAVARARVTAAATTAVTAAAPTTTRRSRKGTRNTDRQNPILRETHAGVLVVFDKTHGGANGAGDNLWMSGII
ncbi:hypothetical protein N8T08_003204 [Aspergillus melleus]|uniref:Uncharacterized protein n=1 Tax=Aspergillus melleus TaxID=138277 RepID=A0ACC3B7Y6_9EURO|nr:hypothetical protein N8T08_003204 [Aspergillus melleus]